MSNHSKAILIVIMSGLIWSFGPLVVKNMTEPQLYQLPYLVIRGMTVATIIAFYLFFNEGLNFLKKLFQIDGVTIIGGMSLTTAFLGFIYSISYTTAAVTLFMLALMPFLASVIAFIFLKEKISKQNFVSMVIAFIGTLVMIYASAFSGSFFGLIMGFVSSLGFAAFSVALRSKSDIKKFYILIYGGIFCALFSAILMIINNQDFYIPIKNVYLSMTHGTLVASGLILFSIGSKQLLSGELTMLSLLEVVGGIFWAWLPILGINEIPSMNTIIGGAIICVAIAMNSYRFDKKRLQNLTR
jgi:DME family drug/metabolite transporter